MNKIKNWALGCAFTVKDLFINFPFKKLKLKCHDCKNIINDNHRNKLVERIFKESVEIIINDIIENNVTFKLPLNGKVEADIHMRRVRDLEFKNMRKAGKWKDVDFITSNFSAYQLGLFLYGKRTPRIKNIYVGKDMRDRIIEHTNNGKQYC